MKLPKLWRAVRIKFWSLRDSLGDGYGVIHDNDVEIERVCRRVACPDGWKWQIVNRERLIEWDYCIERDELSLSEMGMDTDFKLIKNK